VRAAQSRKRARAAQSREAPQRLSDVSTPCAIHTTGGDIEVEMELAGLELHDENKDVRQGKMCYHETIGKLDRTISNLTL